MTRNDAANSSLIELTAKRLRERIVSGEIGPGEKLSETTLAETMDVSRNTLREVFRLLTREGVLQHTPNRGVSVIRPSLASIIDIYHVRRLTEVPCLAQAWPKHVGIKKMRQAVDRAMQFAAQDDWRAVGSENMAFHSAIMSLADSPRFDAFFANIAVELRLIFGLLDSPERLHGPYIPVNLSIVEMAETGDMAMAAKLLDDCLVDSERAITGAFAIMG